VTVRPDGISWQPQIEYAGAILFVSGPGDWGLERTYASGVEITLTLNDPHDEPLPDGQYIYELRFQPALSEAAQGALLAAADTEMREQVVAALRQAGELPAAALALNGTFRVSGGALVLGAEPESSFGASEPAVDAPNDQIQAPLDVVHNDDVIITGSLCVGFDCLTNGSESFGYDTLRLKENNLRIHFNDTSNTGSFPTNDWRILINDTANGGANYYSVQDVNSSRRIFTLEAGAPANSLYVEDYGRVGFGTAAPVEDLHIAVGDTPTVRLDQDGSAGWAKQVWDVAGNESNFFIRDATNGSKLPFRIQPGAPSSSLNLKSDGNVGIGTWSPAYPLELETTGEDAVFAAQRTDGATAQIAAGVDAVQMGSVTDHAVEFTVNGAALMRLDTSGNLTIEGALTEASDAQLKENWGPVDGEAILTSIGELPISTWNYKADDDALRHMGPTAQDFHRSFGLGADERHIAPLDANGVALVGVQELYRLTLAQQAQIEQLQADNQALQERLDALDLLLQDLLAAQGGENE
jgi:hypothetical protein